MGTMTEALQMALAYLEGSDPLSASGGVRNDHARAVIRDALPQAPADTPVHYWWSGHDQIGHFYAKDDEVVPPGGYPRAPRRCVDDLNPGEQCDICEATAPTATKCGIPGAECNYGAYTCRRA